MHRHVFAILGLSLLSSCATPITGDPTPFGGSTDTALANSKYSIRASLNGVTPASALKPAVLQRAKLVAQSKGFITFEVKDFSISYDGRSGGFSVDALVEFFRDRMPTVPGNRYTVDSEQLTPYQEELTQDARRGLALIGATRGKDKRGRYVHIQPAFIDAVSATRNSWTTSTSQTFVRPGLVRFAAYVQVQDGSLLAPTNGTALVPVLALLAPDSRYKLAARHADGILEYWIEDEATGVPVNAIEKYELPVY